MVRFGFHLGAAFQIRDDVLNVADEALYGKEINGDLREGKRTLVLIHLVSHARGADRRFVLDYLGRSPQERTPDVVSRIRGLINRYRSIEFARAYAGGIARAALESFEVAFVAARPGPDTDFVRSLVPYMLDRRR
jgi:geranylgeranyl diphosphate synthase, type II